jgi:hypothetical protein
MKTQNDKLINIASVIIILISIGAICLSFFNIQNLKTYSINETTFQSNDKKLEKRMQDSEIEVAGQLESCKVNILINKSKFELIPGALKSIDLNTERYTYKTLEIKTIKNESKIGSLDINCIGFENTMNKLKNTVETANKETPEKVSQMFQMSYEKFSKLEDKEKYKLFIIKRSGKDECQELDKSDEIMAIRSDLGKRFDLKYIYCKYPYIDNDGNVTKIINYKYLFAKDSSFILQIGDTDILNLEDQYLLTNNL